jgi:hypothetical protein
MEVELGENAIFLVNKERLRQSSEYIFITRAPEFFLGHFLSRKHISCPLLGMQVWRMMIERADFYGNRRNNIRGGIRHKSRYAAGHYRTDSCPTN